MTRCIIFVCNIKNTLLHVLKILFCFRQDFTPAQEGLERAIFLPQPPKYGRMVVLTDVCFPVLEF